MKKEKENNEVKMARYHVRIEGYHLDEKYQKEDEFVSIDTDHISYNQLVKLLARVPDVLHKLRSEEERA